MEVAETRVATRRPRAALGTAAICLWAVGWVAAAGCTPHPVEHEKRAGAVEHRTEPEPSGATKLDLLWVVDNSRSMCEEQKALRDQFPKFVDALRSNPIDFHVAVTTTDVNTKQSCASTDHPQSGDERFDRGPGCLQSRPHPVPARSAPSTGGACLYKRVDGTIHDGRKGRPGPDFEPLRQQLDQARKCTRNAEKWDHLASENLGNDLLECAATPKTNIPACNRADRPTHFIACELDGDASACSKSDRSGNGRFEMRDLFPPPSAYASVGSSRVLRAEDYRGADGKVDVESLRRDFACMSFVGTRGNAYEQGLRALANAVSPERTGGPADVRDPSDPGAPNHGFLRKDANFGAIFVTDENDCSNDSDLTRNRSECGQAECYFSNRVGDEEGPLTPVDELYERFRDNLADSKGVDRVPEDEIFLGTVHGGYLPFQQVEDPPKSCARWERRTDKQSVALVPHTCNKKFGKARSGDRYEKFLRRSKHFYPEPTDQPGLSGKHIPGALCRKGGLSSVFRELGAFFSRDRKACIDGDVPTCDSNADCTGSGPAVENPTCAEHPSREGGFCRSTAQVWLVASGDLDDPRGILEQTGFCATEPNDSARGPACAVDPRLYDWRGCGGSDGMTYEWRSASETGGTTEQVSRKLSDVAVQIRYVSGTSPAGTSGAE